jgi:hypothetical protein
LLEDEPTEILSGNGLIVTAWASSIALVVGAAFALAKFMTALGETACVAPASRLRGGGCTATDNQQVAARLPPSSLVIAASPRPTRTSARTTDRTPATKSWPRAGLRRAPGTSRAFAASPPCNTIASCTVGARPS